MRLLYHGCNNAAADNWRCGGGQLVNLANSPTIRRPQVAHSCVGRNLTVLCRHMRLGRALPFEIPAYAGMVFRGNGNRGRILALLSVGDGSVWVDFGICRRRRIVGGGGQLSAGRRQFSIPPQAHSCVGRNLTVLCRQMRRGRALPFEIPAFAGMVFGDEWELWRIRRLLAAAAADN